MPAPTIARSPETRPHVDVESLKQQLVERLEHGWKLIDVARERGQAIARWEDAWLKLLREYEAVCQAA